MFIHAMSKPEGYLRKNRNNGLNSLRCEVEIYRYKILNKK